MIPEELDRLAGRLDALDVEVFEAEKRRDTQGKVRALRKRARTWRMWAALLKQGGRDNSYALNAAGRDEADARELDGAE